MNETYYHEFAPPRTLSLIRRAHVGDMSGYTGVVTGSGEEILRIADLLDSFKADGIIRLRRPDFNEFLSLKEKFVTFNLGRVTNEPGKRYLVIAIESPGFRNEDVEVLPVLDPANARVGLCTEVRQEVPINEVLDSDFENSISAIRSREALTMALLTRYVKLHSDLSREEILARGCAITTVDFRS